MGPTEDKYAVELHRMISKWLSKYTCVALSHTYFIHTIIYIHSEWATISQRISELVNHQFWIQLLGGLWALIVYQSRHQQKQQTTHRPRKLMLLQTNVGFCYTITKASLTGMLMTAVMTGMLLPWCKTNTLMESEIPLSLMHSTSVSYVYISPGTSSGTVIQGLERAYSESSNWKVMSKCVEGTLDEMFCKFTVNLKAGPIPWTCADSFRGSVVEDEMGFKLFCRALTYALAAIRRRR